ncbi:hypothetical protein [Corynebacterium sp. sy039]|uniref:hypothetical protein n=1 Tax=Corynebacterium sp. sy039 TaxID=2599641 RepID=UPI0011B3F560|nr:hypothetical protein [Corynebacterium sp. sy039]QDZ42451.1 hypothetical protein FQV43_04200 [Corynebacterium sp. sy039]
MASQDEMPLAGSPKAFQSLDQLSEMIDNKEEVSVTKVAEWLFKCPELLETLRVIGSLSDKRLYLDLSYVFSRSLDPEDGTKTICGCNPDNMLKHSTKTLIRMMSKGTDNRKREIARIVANYLNRKKVIDAIILFLNQTKQDQAKVASLWLYPKDAQQNEAKRRGHGAEAEIALLVNKAGLETIPKDKAGNPMGSHDPNISPTTFTQVPHSRDESFSVDILVPNVKGEIAIMIMALVQSSDPGQFGVDKTKTNAAIRSQLDLFRESNEAAPEMWGIIDGIGYAENPNGTIYPMLENFDMFIQHNSAYKTFLGLHRLGLCKVESINYDPKYYSPSNAKFMHERYASHEINFHNQPSDTFHPDAIRAGWADVKLEAR